MDNALTVRFAEKESKETIAAVGTTMKDISEIPPDSVRCMMGIIVTKTEDTDVSGVRMFAFASPTEMGRMLHMLATHVSKGVEQADADAKNGVH